MKSNKEFDRSVCFTFFEDYRKTAKELEADFGKETVADYYNAIIDYALYTAEPELKGPLKYIWPTTKTTIDKSIDRRSNGFKENIEQTEKIIKYKKENPDATQREIAEATNTSLGKVNKVLQDAYAISSSNSNSNTNTCNEREHREHEREHREHEDDDIKLAVIECYIQKYKYSQIQTKIKTELNYDISFDDIKTYIDEYKTNPDILDKLKQIQDKKPKTETEKADYARFDELAALFDENKPSEDEIIYVYKHLINKGKTLDDFISFIKNNAGLGDIYTYVNAI